MVMLSPQRCWKAADLSRSSDSMAGRKLLTMSSAAPDLSIIIPSYNEELRLPATLERIAAYLSTFGRNAEGSGVDDGSKDGTAAVAEYFRIKIPTLRVVSNGINRGKGYSVRHGMQEARGRIALFTDADLSAPIEEAGKTHLTRWRTAM